MVLKAVYGEALLIFGMEAAFRDRNMMERTCALERTTRKQGLEGIYKEKSEVSAS